MPDVTPHLWCPNGNSETETQRNYGGTSSRLRRLESPNSLPALTWAAIRADAVLLAGCDIGLPASPGTGSGNGSDGDAPECESYPLGEPRDPETLDACCSDFGNAHCLPSDVVPDFLSDLVAVCESGGVCVPDPFIAKGGLHVPKDCMVELDGSTGVCMSGCIPEVGQYAGILKQDTCATGEFCTPCISPIDGSDTGACALRENFCGADLSGGSGGGGGACPHEGPPLIDPANFPTCDQCGNSSCVDKGLIPVEFHSRLADCDADSFCVPNELVETAGNFIPTTYTAVAGFEGRCLSECLPEVQEQANLLDQGTSAAAQLCVPCYDQSRVKTLAPARSHVMSDPTRPGRPPSPIAAKDAARASLATSLVMMPNNSDKTPAQTVPISFAPPMT